MQRVELQLKLIANLDDPYVVKSMFAGAVRV
jgi:hypothetical protein